MSEKIYPIFHNIEQQGKKWETLRLGKITCSKFADVMTSGKGKNEEFGKSAYTYAYDIVAEILTKEHKEFDSPALKWGRENEQFARTAYEIETMNKVTLGGYIEFDEMIGGSTDGFLSDGAGIIEIKCPYNSIVHLTNLINKCVPPEYYAQVMGYLLITGRKYCDFVSYDYRFEKELMIVRVQRDEEYIGYLKDRLLKFKQIIIDILNNVNK